MKLLKLTDLDFGPGMEAIRSRLDALESAAGLSARQPSLTAIAISTLISRSQ